MRCRRPRCLVTGVIAILCEVTDQRIENVIIVGSGPAGYTAALYTARANLEPLVIEGFAWGGLLQQTTDVENYPGFPEGIMGPELMQQLPRSGRALRRPARDRRRHRVELSKEGGLHKVWVDDQLHHARTVILAMGAQHRKLGVPGEAELSGRGVSYCATCDAAFFRDAPTDHRRRRRLGNGGGDVPVQVRFQGDRSSTVATSSAPRRSCSSAPARSRISSG